MRVTVALVLVAGSAALLLAVGARLLSHASFSGLALMWTLATVFGLGVATPTEQLINRRLNVSVAEDVRHAVRWLTLALVLAVVATAIVLARSHAAESFPWLLPGACVVFVGWALCAVTRGRLLGAGDLRAYAWSQALEAVTRVLLVLCAIVWRDTAGALLLSAAVGIPLVVAGAWGALLGTERGGAPRSDASTLAREQAAFVLVALGYQLCISAPPLILEWKIGARLPALTGSFVVASSFFRAPLIMSSGVLVAALTSLSRIWRTGDHEAFTARVLLVLRQAVAVVAVATLAAAIVAPLALPILYGGSLGISVAAYVALVASTVLATAVSALTTALLAAGCGWRAAGSWLAGAASMIAVSSVLPVESGVMSWGLVAGPLVALICAGVAVASLRGSWSRRSRTVSR